MQATSVTRKTNRNIYYLVPLYLVLAGITFLIIRSTLMPGTAWDWVCTFSLMGYFTAYLGIAANLYTRELSRFMGVSFTDVHHILTFSAIAFLIAHPFAIMADGVDWSIWLPATTSLNDFLGTMGPIALYIFLIGGVVATLRKRFKTNWRSFHWLVYPAFIIGTVHSALVGTNFQFPGYRIVTSLMAASIIYVFARKRMLRRAPRPSRVMHGVTE
ncbi:MAG: hypothetical protein ACYC6L_16655 [Anaerolineae bacterium]